MQFLYPGMLWGLLALAIPIAIHLFNFRRHKPVYFSNTALLRTIEQENAKTKKLKYIIALLLRCLFIAALVFAFAFPYDAKIDLNTDREDNLVGICIDNSMSMKTQSSRYTLLEDARAAVRDFVARSKPSNRYVLLTNSFEMENEYPMNQEEMLERLDRMSLDGPPVKLNRFIDRFEMLCSRHNFDYATFFVYSDFQKDMVDLSGLHADSTVQFFLVPMSSEFKSNVYIDTVWLASPILQLGLSNAINIRVVNEGEKERKGIPIRFTIDGGLAASITADIEKNGSVELSMQFVVEKAGRKKCCVSLIDHPITFDDSYNFFLDVRPTLKVVELGTAPSAASLIFDEDEQFDYERVDPASVDLTTLSEAQFLVVNESAVLNETMQQKLLDCAASGASIAVFPASGDPKTLDYLYAKLNVVPASLDTIKTKVNEVATQHVFFNDMILAMPPNAELPEVHKHLSIERMNGPTAIMRMQNTNPFLLTQNYGNGTVFLFTCGLSSEWSTLADNALFVPLMLKMALIGGQVGRISYTLGFDNMLTFHDLNVEGDRILKLRSDDGAFEAIPTSSLRDNSANVFVNDMLPSAGFYELLQNDTLVHVLAWNDSRTESKMDFAGQEEVKQAFENAGLDVEAVLSVDDFQTSDLMLSMIRKSVMWKWLVWVALLALLGEVAVLRFWKK